MHGGIKVIFWDGSGLKCLRAVRDKWSWVTLGETAEQGQNVLKNNGAHLKSGLCLRSCLARSQCTRSEHRGFLPQCKVTVKEKNHIIKHEIHTNWGELGYRHAAGVPRRVSCSLIWNQGKSRNGSVFFNICSYLYRLYETLMELLLLKEVDVTVPKPCSSSNNHQRLPQRVSPHRLPC